MDASFLHDAVDFYVHVSPDPIPRRADDLALAQELKDAGLRAALHRHHHAQTADRASLARQHTGFPLFGAIELNGCVGGLNPAAVDVVLANGAVFVGFPTSSAAHMRTPDSWAYKLEERLGLRSDHGALLALDDAGDLCPPAHEILDLVKESDAVVGLGYMSFPECLAVASEAAARGISKIVLTNPTSVGGLTVDEVRKLMDVPGTYLEVVVFTLHPENVGGTTNTDNVLALAGVPSASSPPASPPPSDTPASATPPASASTGDPDVALPLANLIRMFGVGRCLLSSDGGHGGDVAPPVELLWGCRTLAALDFSEPDLRVLVADTPARLLNL